MMRIIIALFALTALTLASDVLDLTADNFDGKTKDEPIVLVEFFAPWCGHCKKLAPEYEIAATALKKSDPPVPIAKIDCTAETELCGKYGVSGYPTLKIFRGGELSDDYNGPRDADGIVKFMKSKAGPSSRELTDAAAAEKFLDTQEYGIIGFFSKPGGALAKTFQKVADTLSSDMRFAHTSEKALLAKYGFDNSIVLFQPKRYHSKFEPSKVKYEGDESTSEIKEWLQENILGLCGERTMDLAPKYKKPLFVAYYDVDYKKNEKGTNYWRNRVMKVGKKILDAGKTAYFAISHKSSFAHELSEFGVTEPSSDKPAVTGYDEKGRKFSMSEEFSMDNLEKFINDVLGGELEPYLKSEPVPSPNDDPVKVVVAKNFDEIVNDETKDVLIEFYAPWCGHCKSLAPKYDELAETLQKTEDDIVIAKMDATANDVPKPYEVQGFPTIFFSPKNSKDSPKKFQGGREIDDFIKYLASESTDKLKGYDRTGKKIKTKTEL